MTNQHVIVIGAGIIGASIARSLAKMGAAVTILTERIGGVATAGSFAWINASWGNPEPYFHLRRHAMAEWKKLAAELPSLPLRWCGSLCWDLPPDRLQAYAAEHGRWGYGIRRVGREEAAALEPELACWPDFALAVAEEGVVEPVDATRLLLADAQAHGAVLAGNMRVTALIESGGRVVGAVTDRGEARADMVVLAAGTSVAALAASIGIEVPLAMPPGLIVHSRPCRKRLNGLVVAPELHMRQTAAGRVIAGGDFAGSDPGQDPRATAEALIAKLKAMLRESDDLALECHTIGHRPTPADGFPVIGRPKACDGLYIAVMHSGITLAPAVGVLGAVEILERTQDERLAPYRLERFEAART